MMGAKIADGGEMSNEEFKGKSITLNNGAYIECYDLKDDSFGFLFRNSDGAETNIRLSAEAIQAMHWLYIDLRSDGVIA